MHKASLQSDLSELTNFVMVAWRNDTFIKPQVGINHLHEVLYYIAMH